MQVLCLYWPRKSKPRLKSELRKQQYTVKLFYFNHLAQVVVLWQMQKFMCYCTVFALFYFEFEGIFRAQGPQGCVFGGAIYRRVFCVTNLWGLYLEGLIFRILRYMAVINLPTNAALTMLNYWWRRLLHESIHRSLTGSDQKDDICPFKKEKLFTALHNYVTNKGQLTRPSALLTTSPERVLEAILFNGINV